MDQSGFNDNLKTIKSNTFEIGIANFKKDYIINYSLRIFNIITKNEITPYETSSGLVLYNNAGKTIKSGLELELNAQIFNEFSLDYNLSVGKYKFDSFMSIDDDYSNNFIPGIPRSHQNIKIKYNNENNFNLIVGLKRTGRMFADNSNKTQIDGYNSITIKMSKNLKLFETNIIPFLSIDNLLNEKYFDNIRINAFGSRYYESASGTNFVAGLKISL